MPSGAVATSRQADGAVCWGLFLPPHGCSVCVCVWGARLTGGILAQLLSRRGRLSNLITFRQTDTRAHGHNRHADAGLSRSQLALRHGWKVK